MKQYLQSSLYIDFNHPQVLKQALLLAESCHSDIEIAKNCFEFVRDQIPHSMDANANPVTLSASEVLKYKTGFCYAKSHLLAALLRANKIPAGFCYQRLSIDDIQPPFCLHGLNAVYLQDYGWYRIDARGNKEGVNAQFTPPDEQLAFAVKMDGEYDLPEIWPSPLQLVIDKLKQHRNIHQLAEDLPDIECANIAC